MKGKESINMFEINADKTISVTRGDSGSFVAPINYALQKGDVLRLKVFRKKACDDVVLQKDFAIGEATETVSLELTENDTRIGEIISKPVDYWYEIELNPDNNPQTLVGYDDDGAKIFRLYPEGRDLEDDELTEEEKDTLNKFLTEFKEVTIPTETQKYVDSIIDTEINENSSNPVSNKVMCEHGESIHKSVISEIQGSSVTVDDLYSHYAVNKAEYPYIHIYYGLPLLKVVFSAEVGFNENDEIYRTHSLIDTIRCSLGGNPTLDTIYTTILSNTPDFDVSEGTVMVGKLDASYISYANFSFPDSWVNVFEIPESYTLHSLSKKMAEVLQELNNSTENEPNATYSANVINKNVVAPFKEYQEYIEQVLGSIVNEIDPDKGIPKGKIPTVEAVYNYGLRIINAHREEVNEQIAELKGDIDDVSALVGGAEE